MVAMIPIAYMLVQKLKGCKDDALVNPPGLVLTLQGIEGIRDVGMNKNPTYSLFQKM